MAKKPTPAPQVKEATLVPGTLEADTAAANQLAVAKLAQNERVSALAKQLNYQGDLSSSALFDGARGARHRVGMAVLEFGAYLLLLREGCEHGKFLPLLESLEVSQGAASRYMTMARKFSKHATSHGLEKLGYSKMAELVVLDDDQAAELLELGQTGELALDEVATMSVKQLRAAVREERQERQADAALLEKKNARIDKLERDLRRVNKLPADDQLALLKKEAASIANDAEGAILGGLRQALIKLSAHGEQVSQAVFMAGLVGQVQAQLTALRAEFSLPDASTLAQQELAAEVHEWAFPKNRV